MMACSYLSAGGMKSEPTGAACWSPPAMAGCLASEMRPKAPPQPTMSMMLPSGPIGLQSGLTGLPSGLMGLPRAPMVQQHETIAQPNRGLPSEQLGLATGPVGLPNQPIGLCSGAMGPVGLPSGSLVLPSGPNRQPTGPILTNAQMGLPPPFARSLPMEVHGTLSQPGSSTEPALDLSTSASSMTSSLKPRLPSPDEDTE